MKNQIEVTLDRKLIFIMAELHKYKSGHLVIEFGKSLLRNLREQEEAEKKDGLKLVYSASHHKKRKR